MIEYRHDVPFKLTGTINMLTFNLGLHQLTELRRAQMKETVAKGRD
jgi:hypothetical protein